jgi:hypothetical protein
MEAVVDIFSNERILHFQVRDQNKFQFKDKFFKEYVIPALKKKKELHTFDFHNCGLDEELSAELLSSLSHLTSLR